MLPIETKRLDPDDLIKIISQEQKRKHKGRLYVFLGMAPGVGKTFAMLLSAHETLREGQDVVVGVVETHGRKETESLLEGLSIIPKRKVLYRGIELWEMDLDAILQRKPKIILVDELAHTNIPGSRHNKRWQDVLEILDAGIDVFSTLNIQHLESRKETIEQITNIPIQETIPDNVLDRAYQIRLIDLSVEDLLKRLKEGKVYLGENAKLAIENFFKEENLTALRELALRTVADRVDNDLQNLTAIKEADSHWVIVERLMVLVDEKKQTEDILRTTRRLAYSLDAPWVALHIDNGVKLNDDEKNGLVKNLALARNLGAEIITTSGANLSKTIIKFVQQKKITQLIIDRNQKSNIFQALLGKSLYEELLDQRLNINILLVQANKSKLKFFKHFFKYLDLSSSASSYFKAICLTLLMSLLNHWFIKFLSYRSIGFIFLLFIIMLGLIFPLGPSLLSAILSILLWNYFFISPLSSFEIKESEDFFMCVAILFSAISIGIVSNKIKKREELLSTLEDRNRVLYEVGEDLAKSLNKKEMIASVTNRLSNYLPGTCDVALKGKNAFLKDFQKFKFLKEEQEMAVARWVLENNKPAGFATDTLSMREALYLPMIGSSETLGVLAFRPQKKEPLKPEDFDLLLSATRHLSLFLEKELLEERAAEIEHLKDIKKQQGAILKFISDEFKRPLGIIIDSAKFLVRKDVVVDNSTRVNLAESMLNALERFEFVIDNLAVMSRLIAGIFPINKSSIKVDSLIKESIEHISRKLKDHFLQIDIEENLPELNLDKDLCRQAIANVILNAAMYSPKDTEIKIDAKRVGDEIILTISDNGPGIPEKYIGYIFDLFYRIPGSLGKGVGLGLALAKGVIKAHGGKISVSNKEPQGAVFTISFPIPLPY